MAVFAGAVRYNNESNKLELYDGNQWVQVVANSFELQTSGSRGLFAGGYLAPGGNVNIIEYATISSAGNATDFGDLTSAKKGSSRMSSSTRGIFAGGYTQGMDYVTISSTGNGISFGNLSQTKQHFAGISNSTRGIVAGGYVPSPGGGINVIEYVTISATGNMVDFGDLSGTNYFCGGCGSSTRGLIGGASSTTLSVNTIEYITVSSTGNATDFGDLTTARRQDSNQSLSNSIRAIFGGGYIVAPGAYNTIDYVTIATTGNATDFGDHTASIYYRTGTSSPTRGVFAGGGGVGTEVNTMDYISIMTLSNAIDFGDLATKRFQSIGLSNCHGGL